MHFCTVLGLAASIAGAQAVSQGFNYGATKSDGYTAMEEADYEARFSRAKTLEGTSGFTSARLYTMIQQGTTNTPSSAFQAAINTKTELLLGVWCSAGQATVTNEINAFKSAVQQYGNAFTSLIVGISVGSEDLYRVSPTGIENKSGLGSTPDELVSYIKQVRSAISGTGASGASIGHVDTWTAWVNGSNNAVIEAVDWLGMDTYPYFQTTVQNSIETSNKTFWDAYGVTAGAANGKEVWITETGWPVSGKTSGQAVASIQNAETYWQEVGCALLGNYNTWWYTLEDSIPTTPNPSFGIIGSDLNSKPLYDLKCKKTPSTTKTGSGSHATGKHAASGHTGGGSHAPYGGSNGTHTAGTASPTGTGSSGAGASGSASGPAGSGSPTGGAASGTSGAPLASATGNGASQASSAIGAAILAIFGLVATL